jgi:hypothetical protein
MFPDLHQTRFAQLSDFYSLVILVHKLLASGCILTSKVRNRIAWVFLREFAAKVEELRDLHNVGRRSQNELEIYREYLQTRHERHGHISESQKAGGNPKAANRIAVQEKR